MLIKVPKNIGVEPFPDHFGHFGTNLRQFWICRQLANAPCAAPFLNQFQELLLALLQLTVGHLQKFGGQKGGLWMQVAVQKSSLRLTKLKIIIEK